MAIENDFVNDSSVFLERKTAESKYQFTMIHDGLTMGVWVDVEKALMYMSPEYDPSSKKVYCLTTDDLREGVTLLKGAFNKNLYTVKMMNAFKQGQLRFDNQRIRTVAYDMFKLLNYR